MSLMCDSSTSVLPSQQFSVCVCIVVLWSCGDHVINLHRGRHFTPVCWICKCSRLIFFFFLSLRPPSSDSIKNPLVIRFCAAVGSAFSFFLPTTVGGEEWKGGGRNHVRSTQRAPKLDHVSAPTRSLRMRHKSPLTSWKMAGNQMCTTYGINATEMSPLTKDKGLSYEGRSLFHFISFHFTLLFFIFHGPNRPQIRSLETFSSINSDSTMGGTEFTFKMYPEVEALLHWMAAALKGDH